MAGPTSTDEEHLLNAAAALRPRMGRRVFGSLAVTAIVPALLAMLLAFRSVSGQLEDGAYDRLHVEAQNYSLSVYARLELAQQLLERAAATGAVDGGLDRYFDRIEPSGSSVPKLLLERNVASVDPASAASTVWLGLATERGSVRGAVSSSFLFGAPDLFPHGLSFCISTNAGGTVFCPAELDANAREAWQFAARQNSSGRFSWQADDGEHLAAYFTIPLFDKFDTEGIRIAAVQQKAAAMAPADGFKQATLPAIAIVVLTTLWFGYRLVRGRLAVLGLLTESASRMSRGDLATPVEVESDDEFGTIGRAFEHARVALASQFSTLNALSELDRAILKDADIDTIYRACLRYMAEIFSCTSAYVVVLHHGTKAPPFRVTLTGERNTQRTELPHSPSFERLDQTGVSILDDQAATAIIGEKAAADRPAGAYAAARVASPEGMETAVVLGFADADAATAIRRRILSDFLDRLAVAQHSFERSKRLYQQAHYDELTGLPNRQLFLDRLERLVALAEHGSQQAALLFIDLDDFKSVNDSRGHPVGDILLRLSAQRIRQRITRRDTAARLGGDEFGVVLADVDSASDVQDIANEFVAALSAPFEIDGIEHFLGASVGIAISPTDGTDADTLLRKADTAMYKAKSDGKGRPAFYEEKLNAEINEHVRINTDLRRAIENGEFELYYQPKLCLESGRIHSAEALIRWHHPARGFIPPDRFIGVAERSHLIVDIGEWVAGEAVRQLAKWQADARLERVAINVSYRQLHDSNLEDLLHRQVSVHGLDPASLELEFTESIAASGVDRATEVFGRLRSRGFRVAIDDFGTGYSSFGYLTDMTFDVIKIDRMFLEDFPHNPQKHAVVAGIVQMAKSLGKETVAEGVEQREQSEALRDLGCDTVQGYLVGAPMCARDFEVYVDEFARAAPRRKTG